MNYYFTVSEPKEGSCELTGMMGIDENAPPEIAQSYIDFFRYISMYTAFESHLKDAGIAEVIQGNHTLLFALNKVLPFFRFSEMFMKEDEKIYIGWNVAEKCQSGKRGFAPGQKTLEDAFKYMNWL